MYRLVERTASKVRPPLRFENVQIDGEWINGPVIGNYLGHWDTECARARPRAGQGDGPATFRKARTHLIDSWRRRTTADYPEIPPV